MNCWIRAFVLYHGKKHPRELGLLEVKQFLEHVVRTEKQPLPAMEIARSALELLYGRVLGMELGELPRPQPPRLLDQMSQVLRVRHYSPRTEACYLHWARHFIPLLPSACLFTMSPFPAAPFPADRHAA